MKRSDKDRIRNNLERLERIRRDEMYASIGLTSDIIPTDTEGSYTGVVINEPFEEPVQDADDL